MLCKFCGYENSLVSERESAKCFQCGAEINSNDKSIELSSIIEKTSLRAYEQIEDQFVD